jgi:hypothetical protein
LLIANRNSSEEEQVARKMKERRRKNQMVIVDRRRGKIRMYGEIVLCTALVANLIWLLR